MSKAQGQFTIIDYNDALTLTGYIGSNLAKTQMYNPDNDTYTPDWSDTNLVLTPSLYVIGTTTDQITSSNVTSVKWYIGSSTTAITSSGNYALSGTKSHILTIKDNVMAGLPGIDYRCVITYKDDSTGLSITHPLTISFSRVVNGSGITDLLVATPSGNVFKNSEVATLTATAELWRGSTVDTTNVTYKWAIMDSSVTSSSSSGYDAAFQAVPPVKGLQRGLCPLPPEPEGVGGALSFRYPPYIYRVIFKECCRALHERKIFFPLFALRQIVFYGSSRYVVRGRKVPGNRTV